MTIKKNFQLFSVHLRLKAQMKRLDETRARLLIKFDCVISKTFLERSLVRHEKTSWKNNKCNFDNLKFMRKFRMSANKIRFPALLQQTFKNASSRICRRNGRRLVFFRIYD